MEQVNLLGSISCSAASACVAVLYSNIFETVKTRMQLDGEGESAKAKRAYNGVFDATRKIYRSEGWSGLQSGLRAALVYQTVFNGTRIGCYDSIQNGFRQILGADDRGAGSSAGDIAIRAAAGATSGAIGSTLASPIYLVKNRLQAEGAGAASAVREHHGYTTLSDGLRKVYAEEGVRGLFRGIDGAILRVMVGSGVQLATYDWNRELLQRHSSLQRGSLQLTLTSSLITSLITVTLMNPFDVVSTRLYQSSGKATSYAGILDCARQTLRAEGWSAFMKGWTPQYLRLGPHTIITFLMLETLKPAAAKIDIFSKKRAP